MARDEPTNPHAEESIMAGVFISYSHKDEAWKDRLVAQLGVLAGEGLETWDDRRIAGGDDWLPEIEQAMANCDVALLLISASFLTSKFTHPHPPVPRPRRTRQGASTDRGMWLRTALAETRRRRGHAGSDAMKSDSSAAKGEQR